MILRVISSIEASPEFYITDDGTCDEAAKANWIDAAEGCLMDVRLAPIAKNLDRIERFRV